MGVFLILIFLSGEGYVGGGIGRKHNAWSLSALRDGPMASTVANTLRNQALHNQLLANMAQSKYAGAEAQAIALHRRIREGRLSTSAQLNLLIAALSRS
jgi:hypothetical protein